nr:purine nucleoside phosphorylase DeoD-type-like [Marmota flaviventris]XP_034491552.1 purine nucleoside phosphorylase DeoD-type-like [Marmota flaviventris]
MGVGSAGIYIHELYDVYKVERIIRVGSCGSYTDTIALGDTALINESVTEDTLLPDLFYDGKSMPYLKPNEELTEKLRQSAKKLGYDLPEGRSYCKDVLYAPMTADDMATKFGVKLAEFESYALFFYADMMGKKAAALAAVVGTRDPVTNMPVLLAAEKHMDMRCKAIEIVLNAGLED